MKKPLIGIVLDRELGGEYSQYPYYVLREHYFSAVIKAGGIPVGIDHSSVVIEEYAELLDGLLMPGGDYDIPPAMYGDSTIHETVVTKPERLDFDLCITKKFLDKDKPILGICAGEQLLAVMHGGTLVQDIASEVADSLNHYASDREIIAHQIFIDETSVLYSVVGKSEIGVNSHHHQSVKDGGDGLLISARSSDGVVEAIEVKGKRFCIGVQWHPEFLNDQNDTALFVAFIRACSEYKKLP